MDQIRAGSVSKVVMAAGFLVAGLLPGAGAQDWARAKLDKSPRHGEYVTIHEKGGRDLHAWVVYPETKGKAPVIVMIHEIFGLSDWAREMADEIAGAGYIVVEPDLLSGLGQPPVSTAPMPDGGHMHDGVARAGDGSAFVSASPGGTSAFADQGSVVKAVSSLPDPQVLADLHAAADYGEHLSAASGKLFVAGFCWGGGKSFLFATARRDLADAFVFYGPPPPAEAMKSIAAPVYGFYAANDARITSTVDSTKAAMTAAGKTFDAATYDGAGHGFMRAGEAPDASAENQAARQTAFRRWVELMGGLH